MHWMPSLGGGPRRVNHAGVLLGERIFSFGGYCAQDQAATSSSALDDLQPKIPMDVHVLSTTTLRWRRLPVPSCKDDQYYRTPYQRYGHTVVVFEGRAYVWGGRSDPDGSCNTVYAYDPECHEFEMVTMEQAGSAVPGARDGHTAVVIGDEMVIFGGFVDEEQAYGQDVWAFSFRTRRWRELHPEGPPPAWRDFHSATAIGDRMYVFGGRSDDLSPNNFNNEVYCNTLIYLDLTAERWVEPEVTGPGPCGRRSHSSWESGGRLFLFGGYNGLLDSHYGDLKVFDPVSRSWNELRPSGSGPGARRRQVTIQVGERLFLFGGTTPRRDMEEDPDMDEEDRDASLQDLDDLHILEFRPTLYKLAAHAVIAAKLPRTGLPLPVRADLGWWSEPNRIPVLAARHNPASA